MSFRLGRRQLRWDNLRSFKSAAHSRCILPNSNWKRSCTTALSKRPVYKPQEWQARTRPPMKTWPRISIQTRWHRKRAEGSSVYRDRKLDPDLAYIALGSNVGDRVRNIENALAALRAAGFVVRRTSCLYSSSPMYVEKQADFYNAVCAIEIPKEMSPHEMLARLQIIELQLGRIKTIDKGPRSIDLDILLFGREKVNMPDLVIPHHSMLEREFVLRPLADLIPDKELRNPAQTKRQEFSSVSWWLNALPQKIPTNVCPIHSNPTEAYRRIGPENPRKDTLSMAIFNMTPDSFSDGGRHSFDPTDPQLQAELRTWPLGKTSLFDVGGQSTRPNAPQVTVEEELGRVLPLIRHIRGQPEYDEVSISIDTYRASVARAAVEAGADIVNDVSAGQLDPDMFKTVAELRCPIILMHMRGDPLTMSELTDYPNGLIRGIAEELISRVQEAEKAGIPRWRIILDPGIGFAKSGSQNMGILASFEELRQWPGLKGFPWLVGVSRKKFIGDVTGIENPQERDWGTAAAITAAIRAGVDIVRIHNPALCATVKMAQDLYRRTQ